MKTISFCRLAGLTGLALSVAPCFAAPANPEYLDQSFPARPGGKLVIDADQGSIVVKTDGTDQVRIQVFRKVHGWGKAKGEELLANHEVTFSQTGDSISVVAANKKPRSGSWFINPPWLEVRYQVNLPPKYSVDLKTSGGDIQTGALEGDASARTTSGSVVLGNIGGKVLAADSGGDISIEAAGSSVNARTSSGSIKVEKAGGKVEVSDAGGDILVGEAAGDVTAATTSGNITVKSAQGGVDTKNAGGDIKIDFAGHDVQAQTTSGSIRLGVLRGAKVKAKDAGGDIQIEEASGSVWAETTSGSIKIKTITGSLEAKDAGGDVSIGRIGGSAVARTSSGWIRIQRVQGDVEAKDQGGDVRIDEAGGQAVASTSSGSILLGLVKGRVEARNSGGDIRISEARSAVMASTSSGNIEVTLVAPPKDECRFEVSGGGIKLALPKTSALNLDAHASGGDVVTELPIAITGRSPRNSDTLQGQLNGGGPLLVLRSSSGDIRLMAAPLRLGVENP